MTAPIKTVARPLSPHVLVYRWPLAAILSILHRATGVGLVLGMLMLTWWVAAAASGPAAFQIVGQVMSAWYGQLVLFGFSAALFFHLCNGIRHLFWDAGAGFEKTTTATTNIVVIVSALILTAASWLLAYM